MGSDVVRADHVLLSVLDVEGTAGQVLRGLSVDPSVVREALVTPAVLTDEPTTHQLYSEDLSRAGDLRPIESKRFAEPFCSTCGSPLRGSLAKVELPVGSPGSDWAGRVNVIYCTACGTAIGVVPAQP
jgi:hypothetical protein